MRIIVFSDSHNNFFKLKQAVEQQKDADLFLHLGDGEREFDDIVCCFPQKRFLSVRGNCDWATDKKTEDLVVCMGKRIFFTHGHLYGVKRDTSRLLNRALELNADICCFGHTHIAVSTYESGVYIFNPGSIARPAAGLPSYGIIDITDAGIAANHVTLR